MGAGGEDRGTRAARVGSRRRLGAVALLLAGGVLAVACSDDDGGEEGTTSGGGGETGRWSDLLRYVPDTEENRASVSMGDADAASEAHDLPRPTEEDADRDIGRWFATVEQAEDGSHMALWSFEQAARSVGEDTAFRSELGWSWTQMDRFVSSAGGPAGVFVVRGDFDVERVRAVLGVVPFWGERQDEVAHGEVTYFRWEDGQDVHPEQASPARPLGTAGPMSVTERRVVQARTDEVMEVVLDDEASGGGLLGVEAFRLAAEALDDEPVAGAFFSDDLLDGTDPASVLGPRATPEQLEAFDPDDHGPLLEDVEVLATGYGLDGGQNVCILVLVAGTEEAAERNIEVMEERIAEQESSTTKQPFDELFDVERTAVEGRVSILWLETDIRPDWIVSSIFQRDTFVLTDG
jgi:hypothetical protein